MSLLEFERFQEILSDITTIDGINKSLHESMEYVMEDGRINRLVEIRDKMEKELVQVQKCIEQAKTLKFKKGDVVWSKDEGPIVVKEVYVNSEGWSSQELPFVFYYKGFSTKGEVTVKADEVINYTDTTRILFKKED